MPNNIGTLLVELGINSAAFIEGFDKATYKAKESARAIGGAFKGLGEDIGGILGRFGEMGGIIGEALAGAGSTIAHVAGEMGSLGGAAGAAAIGVAAVGAVSIAAAAGLGEMAIAGAELVHELSMVSQKTGISITDLQGLKAAGETVGVSLDAMVTGFRRFDQALIGMGKGGSAAQVVLKNLGVTSLDNSEALNQVADAFAKMENGPRKAADAVALFGRSGLNLIPLLNKGREGIEEFNRLVDEYGPKIGADAVKANEDYLVSQVKLNLSWDSMKVNIETAVLPALSKMIEAMADAMKGARDLGKELSGSSGGHGIIATAKALTFDYFHRGSKTSALGALENETANGPEALAQKNNETIRKNNEAAALKQEYQEKQIALTIKDQGKAATALRLEKEKIAELEQAGKWDLASKEYPKLPAMEKAASLEKRQLAYRLDPKEAALGADKVDEMNAKLDEEITKQQALAKTIGMTSSEQAIATAVANEEMKISDEARNLTNEQKKAEEELARLNHEQGTQAFADATKRVAFLQKERDELDASTASMIEKAKKAATIADDTKMAKKIMDERLALLGEAEAWEYVTDAIGKGTEAKIEAEVAAARVKARIENKTPEEIDVAGEKAGQNASQSAARKLKEKAVQLDLNNALMQQLEDLTRIEAVEGKSIGTIYARKEAILSAQKAWDKEAMSVGDLNDRIAAGLNELRIDGQDFWKKFEESGITAVQSMEGELAKLVTGSKTNFTAIAKQFEENFVKNGISAIISKGAGGLLNKTGLGGLIPGVGGKHDGSTRNSQLYVETVNAPLGSLAPAASSVTNIVKGGGGGGGALGLLGTIGSFFGLPFLAGGGDVTPGKAYVVGENHPEFFVPNQPGTIHPSLKMGGHTQNVTHVHIEGVTDFDSFKRNESQVGQRVTNAVSRANSRR